MCLGMSLNVPLLQSCIKRSDWWKYTEFLFSPFCRYIDSTSPENLKPDARKHGPFYSLCQTLFYIFSFRHLALLQMRGGKISDYSTCQLLPEHGSDVRILGSGNLYFQIWTRFLFSSTLEMANLFVVEILLLPLISSTKGWAFPKSRVHASSLTKNFSLCHCLVMSLLLGAEYLRKLKFERLITSQLNPLKVIIVNCFGQSWFP